MSWGMVAVAGASLVGGAMGANASKKAANTQAGASDRATDLQREMYQTTRNDQALYREAGNLYLNKLMHLLGQGPNVDHSTDPNFGRLSRSFNMGDFQADPGYQFRMNEGMKGLTRAAQAGGMAGSGKFLKDAMKFNQGMASDEYGNAYNRWNNDNSALFNRYASISGIGQTANNTLAQAGQNYANGAGGAIMAGGNARASGYMGAANAISGGIGQGVSAYQNGQLMNSLLSRQPTNVWGGTSLNNHFTGFGTGGD